MEMHALYKYGNGYDFRKKAGFVTFLAVLQIRNLLNILSHTLFLFNFYFQIIWYQSDPLTTVSPSSSLAAQVGR